MQAAVIAAHLAVDAAGFAPHVVQHGQVCGGGVGGRALSGRPTGFTDDWSIRVSQQRLSKVWLLQNLPALVHRAAAGETCTHLSACFMQSSLQQQGQISSNICK